MNERATRVLAPPPRAVTSSLHSSLSPLASRLAPTQLILYQKLFPPIARPNQSFFIKLAQQIRGSRSTHQISLQTVIIIRQSEDLHLFVR